MEVFVHLQISIFLSINICASCLISLTLPQQKHFENNGNVFTGEVQHQLIRFSLDNKMSQKTFY